MTAPIYQIRNLVHYYNDKAALVVDDLTIPPASITGLMGPNGSGKSTLLKLLAFVQLPTRGEVLYHGKPAAPFDDTIRFEVTLLPQIPYLMKRTVYDNIRYGLRIRRDSRDIRKRVFEALGWVGLSPADFAERSWNELSGGEAQRVVLAARLILRPRVLLLDEPIASVDAASAQLIKEASLRARQEWGTTLVIASHDAPWLADICDEVRHLFNGRVFNSGTTNILFGPWEPRSDGYWEKQTGNGGCLIVPPPPRPDAVAVIAPEDLCLRLQQGAVGIEGELCGSITRLTLEKATRRTMADISLGGISLSITLPSRTMDKESFFPGQGVFISYDPSQIQWF